VGTDYGDFDLICHIAFDQPPLTRAERANNVKKRNYFTQYGDKARAVLEALLDKYADEGIVSIENNNVLKLDPFKRLGTPVEIINGVLSNPFRTSCAGRRRGRRRPAHQPAVLDVLPQNHRRPGSGAGAAAGRLPLADSEQAPVAQLGRDPEGITGDALLTSSTTICSRR
jgi:hypothetical protein